MRILKTLLFCVSFVSLLNASTAELFRTLGYENNYEQTLKKAKKEKKIMMLVISEKTCPWCRKLEQQVLKKEKINKLVQKDFVGIGLEKNDDIYPKKFMPKVVPTIVFVNPQDESIIFKSYGYIPKKEFIIVLSEVNQEFKKITK